MLEHGARDGGEYSQGDNGYDGRARTVAAGNMFDGGLHRMGEGKL